jgi:hypothetical protein
MAVREAGTPSRSGRTSQGEFQLPTGNSPPGPFSPLGTTEG